jgi:uncharacterized Zn finger protein
MKDVIVRSCGPCGEEQEHEVLRRRGGALTLKCTSCSNIVRMYERAPRTTEVKVIVSKGERSAQKRISLPHDDIVAVGDVLIIDSKRVKVTSISMGEARVENAPVTEISTIWAIHHESVPVHFSINKGSGATISEVVHVPPEEEFETDTIEEIKGRKVLIHAIKTSYGTVRNGSAAAEDIVRVYAKYVREKWGR